MKKLLFLLGVILVSIAGCKKDNAQDGIDHQLIIDYLQKNNLTASAQHTGSGLYYIVTAPGDATRPLTTSTVYVKYTGTLLDGTQFDSSYEASEQPASFAIYNTIKGFAEGLRLFGKGGKGKLFIPSSLGYGGTATGSVPANSVLIFDFELVNFN
jgi:FKBP-type peptidyl-prolyl cis-trans isomerase FkpA